MRNAIYALIAAFVLMTSFSYADVTVKKDAQGQPIGRFENIRFITGGQNCTPTGCTGGSGAVFTVLTGASLTGIPSAGDTIVVDLTNPTGINWQALNALGTAGVNWTGANINAATGVNWEALRVANGNTSTSVNWQAFGV